MKVCDKCGKENTEFMEFKWLWFTIRVCQSCVAKAMFSFKRGV